MKRFTKKQFEQQCSELEELGYSLVEFEPARKYAKFVRNGVTRTIGG
jgi:hypothetical protein